MSLRQTVKHNKSVVARAVALGSDSGFCPSLRRRRTSLFFLGLVCTLTLNASAQESFVRGDINGDGGVDGASDFVQLLGIWSSAFPEASMSNCIGAREIEVGDVNDNESFGLGDLMSFGYAFFEGGPTYPPLFGCGADPTDTTRGFDEADTDYVLAMPCITSTDDKVEIPVFLKSPQDVQGISFALRIGENMVPQEDRLAQFDSTVNLDPATSVNWQILEDDVLSIHIGKFTDFAGEPVLAGTNGEFVKIGTLRFALVDPPTEASFEWLPDFTLNTFPMRATVATVSEVGAPVVDHHPLFTTNPDVCTDCCVSQDFIRGDVSGDGSVDIQDLVAFLNALSSPASPLANTCGPSLEGADVNDNEFLSFNDVLLIGGIQFGGLPVPLSEPHVCGPDPTDTTRGFDQVDPRFEVSIPCISRSGTELSIPIDVQSPTSIQTVSFALRVSPNIVPSPGQELLTLNPSIDESTLASARFHDDLIVVDVAGEYTVATTNGILPPTGATPTHLGTLRLALVDPEGDASIEWVPDFEIHGIPLRATVVSGLDSPEPFEDHHPSFSRTDAECAGLSLFRRGDHDGSGAVDLADGNEILAFLASGSAAPENCVGEVDLDVPDVNDNEHVTIGDFLKLRSSLSGSSLELSNLCGRDPTNDPRGFDAADSDYVLTASRVQVILPPPPANQNENRDVWIPLSLIAPGPVTGLQLMIEYDPRALTPLGDAEGGVLLTSFGDSFSRVVPVGPSLSILIVSLYAAEDGSFVVSDDTGGAFFPVGTLRFHLTDNAVFRPLLWRDELSLPGEDLRYHASVVDAEFDDHRPLLRTGEFEFVRGNANSDAQVDISDGIFTLNFLFDESLNEDFPNCFAAMDVNNDEVLDISDPIFQLNFLFANGPVIPQPFPQCGLDRGGIPIFSCNPPVEEDACFDPSS